VELPQALETRKKTIGNGTWDLGLQKLLHVHMVCPKNIKVTEAILKTKKKIIQELHPKSE